jgi:hypothetical protein
MVRLSETLASKALRCSFNSAAQTSGKSVAICEIGQCLISSIYSLLPTAWDFDDIAEFAQQFGQFAYLGHFERGLFELLLKLVEKLLGPALEYRSDRLKTEEALDLPQHVSGYMIAAGWKLLMPFFSKFIKMRRSAAFLRLFYSHRNESVALEPAEVASNIYTRYFQFISQSTGGHLSVHLQEFENLIPGCMRTYQSFRHIWFLLPSLASVSILFKLPSLSLVDDEFANRIK